MGYKISEIPLVATSAGNADLLEIETAAGASKQITKGNFIGSLIGAGTTAARPAASVSNTGQLYIAVDQNAVETPYLSTGTAWLQIARSRLIASMAYYVATTGSDFNNGFTSGTPFRTIQHAVDVASAIDTAGLAIQINVAAGTYNEQVNLRPFVGTGIIHIIGDINTPSNVVVSGAGLSYSFFSLLSQGWDLQGMSLSGAVVASLSVSDQSYVTASAMDFGAVGGAAYHILAQRGALLDLGNYSISGGGLGHMNVLSGAEVSKVGGFVLVKNLPNFPAPGQVVQASNNGNLISSGVVFRVQVLARSRTANVVTLTLASGHNFVATNVVGVVGMSDSSFNAVSATITAVTANTIKYTLAGPNVATTPEATGYVDPKATARGTVLGKRYNAIKSANIDTSSGNLNYFPGRTAGTVATGGVYT